MRFSSIIPTFLLLGSKLCAHGAPTASGSLTFADGDDFRFEYVTTDANEKNWIGIYHTTGGPDDEKQHDPSLRWVYAPESRGSVDIPAPVRASGEYKAYFLANDGYSWLAEPMTFTPESRNPNPPEELRILTYNLWMGGENVNNFHDKQVRFLIYSGADIVGFQEASGDHAKRLGNALGWNYHQANSDDTSALISRHPIVERHAKVMDRSAGVAINLDSDSDKKINFWSIHATAYPYGPYEFCFEGKDNDGVNATENESGRVKELNDVVTGTKSQRESAKPFIMVGDFNAPSHLDWVEETKESHCGAVFKWPTSEIPTNASLTDSFRVAHPDPLQVPGNTWSPIFPYNEDERAPEPQDRIDFIYHANGLEVMASEVMVEGEPKPDPDYADNEWTSDHAAVLTTYKLK